MNRPIAAFSHPPMQIWWVRLFGPGLALCGPRYPVYFSERIGVDRALVRIAGWRLVYLKGSP